MRDVTTILLVEDDPADITIARLAFRRASVPNELHVLHTVEQALLYLQRKVPYAAAVRPDVIFVDLGLPGTRGEALLEALRDDPDLADIPVLVLTGSDDEAAIHEAYRLHARCFLTKPVDLTLLLEAMTAMDGFFGELESAPEPS
ncbi:MAG: response regulator [Myxococcota bacterium]